MKVNSFASIIAIVGVTLGLSAFDVKAQGYSGTGNNFGSGWKSDGNGGFRGTGNNFGSGWKSDGNGGLRGTGNNFGSGWRRR